MFVLSMMSKVRFAYLLILLSAGTALGQNISFNYLYKFEPAIITEGPELGGLDVAYPQAARKNGVVGTAKVAFTLGEDGQVRDATLVQDLPFGVGEAVLAGVKRLTFRPASFNGKPTAMKVSIEYVVTMVYEEWDKDVIKPKITEKPLPPYPQKYAAEKVKGKVLVSVLFLSMGEVRVGGASSTMPREFDKAAIEAAKLIKFTPAVHKKSKQPVSQQMAVEYDFKP